MMVEDFIRTYKLDNEQTQRARLFLGDALRRLKAPDGEVRTYLERAELLQRDWLERAEDPDLSENDLSEMSALTAAVLAAVDEVVAPARRVRDEFLVPRLYRLLTREQAKAPEGTRFRQQWKIEHASQTTKESQP